MMDEGRFFDLIYNDIVDLAGFTKPFIIDAAKHYTKKYDDIGYYTVCFEEDGSDKFDAIVDKIKEYDNIAGVFSDEPIESFIKDIYLDAGAYGISSSKGFRGLVRKAITGFFGLITDWLFITPLEGIDYQKERRIARGDIKIGVFTKNIKEYRTLINTINGFSISEDDKGHFKEEINNKYLGNACVYLTVNGEAGKAKELAVERTIRFIDCFNYYIPSVFPRSYRCCVNIKGHSLRSESNSLLCSPNNTMSMKNSVEGRRYPFILDTGNYGSMKRFGLFDMLDLVQKPEPRVSKFEKQILLALKWFANGVKTFDDVIAFMSFVNVLEAIYNYTASDEDRSISDKISEGVALCLYKKLEKRKEIRRIVKKIYGTRSDIVHGREFEINDEVLDSVIYLSQYSIYYMLRERDKYTYME